MRLDAVREKDSEVSLQVRGFNVEKPHLLGPYLFEIAVVVGEIPVPVLAGVPVEPFYFRFLELRYRR